MECELYPDEPFLLLVADGLGGHAAGDRASQFAADVLACGAVRLNGATEIASEIIAVSEALRQLEKTDRKLTGMGTTVVGLSIVDECAFVFNVGDSCLFMYEHGALVQLSTSDEYASPPGTTMTSPLITQSLGPRGSHIEPHVNTVRLPAPGSVATFLLCSDGVTDLVSLDALEDALAATAGDPRAAADRILTTSLSAGGEDNISVIVADVIADGRRDSGMADSGRARTPTITDDETSGAVTVAVTGAAA